MFSVEFKDLAGNRITPFWNEVTVGRMSWEIAGGCRLAALRTSVAAIMAAQLLGMAGMYATIYDDKADATWWGYVDQIEISIGGIRFVTSTDELANRVALKYTYEEPGSNGLGEAALTAWADDIQSQALFGVKELIVNSAATMTAAAATARRDVELAWRKYLRASGSFSGGEGEEMVNETAVEVVMSCRGLFDLYNWKYASWPAVSGPNYTTTAAHEQAVGAASSSSKVMQQFTVGAGGINVLQLSVYARKQGSPADNLVAGVYALDGSGNPTGSALASWALAGGSVGASLAWITQSVTEKELDAAAQYGLQVSRSGAVDASNYFVVGVNEAKGYAGGAFKVWNGSAWVARGTDADLCFNVLVNDLVETSKQIRDLSTNFGPSVINAEIIEANSGVFMRSFRDGETTALKEIEELLEGGTVNGRRLMCEVDANRNFVLREEPADTTVAYSLDKKGNLFGPQGNQIPAHRPAIGVYVRLRDLMAGASSSVRLADPTVQFIDSAEWSEGSVSFKFRGG